MNRSSSDPVRDWEIRDALRATAPVPNDVDWTRLRRSIEDRATLELARRRAARVRRERARWMRPLVPAAAAAGLAVVITFQALMPLRGGADDSVEATGIAALRPVFEEVLGAPLTEAELDLLLGEVNADRLVVAALASY
jgi:hypothetical protein